MTADPLIAVGTRFTQEATANWRTVLPRNLVHIDIDIEEIGKNYPVAVGLPADAKLALAQLIEALRPLTRDRAPRSDEARQVDGRARVHYRDRMPREAEILAEIREATPREAILVSDATRVGYWATMVMPFYRPGSLVYPSYHTVGGGFPTALGAKIAAPDRPVLALVGDGGFQYSFAELATAAQYGLGIVVLLVNDRQYGIVAEGQRARFGREVAVDLSTNPDFQGIVRSYGLPSMRLETWEGIDGALRDAFAAAGFRVIEVCEAIRTPPWAWSE